MDYPFIDNRGMTITDIISANLDAWMRDHPTLDTLKKVSGRSGVGFGTVRRVKNGDGNPTINNLYDIARVFGRTVEDLIRPPTGGDAVSAAEYSPSQRDCNVIGLTVQGANNPGIDELVTLAKGMSKEGQYILLGRAQELAVRYPQAQRKPFQLILFPELPPRARLAKRSMQDN